ncbi:tyrosine-type recombinase/integrase [Streptomyces sp. H27-C3]|uniref:tyrosine-type recombinase/integrase n=1 Tax=Streptomyces sp. H27-C3 TaxID=3046305 RepID=UPI0024BAE2EE|nr:tyrosine-type recombinase/integrase [Streptomyces sp. H27-C3]MDJ0463101.1 tyrosine-type recombinase/integrase [Streptomyces sp. H27-C3]
MSGKTPFKKAQRAVDQWLLTKKDRTREEYERDISRYVRHCVALGINPLKARPDTAATFITALRDEYGLKPRTRLRAYNVGSAFYNYAVRWEYAKRNPFQDVEKPKIVDEPELGMSMDEAVRFLKEAFYTSERLYALVVTLLLLGLRISELLGADIEDMGMVQGQRVLWVLRKGRDEKLAMPLPDFAFAALLVCIGDRTKGPIFITGSGKRLSRQGAHDTIVRLGRRSGVPHIHPHLIRATTTVLLLELEQALHLVQELMDHNDPRTTIGYNKARKRIKNSPVFALERALVEASQ